MSFSDFEIKSKNSAIIKNPALPSNIAFAVGNSLFSESFGVDTDMELEEGIDF